VEDRLKALALARLTLDFDGSVIRRSKTWPVWAMVQSSE